MYSNALFGPEEGGVRGDKVNGFTMGHLESAQLRKLHHVLTQARVKPGDRVLEWGTGWGGCAIEVCQSFLLMNSFLPLDSRSGTPSCPKLFPSEIVSFITTCSVEGERE